MHHDAPVAAAEAVASSVLLEVIDVSYHASVGKNMHLCQGLPSPQNAHQKPKHTPGNTNPHQRSGSKQSIGASQVKYLSSQIPGRCRCVQYFPHACTSCTSSLVGVFSRPSTILQLHPFSESNIVGDTFRLYLKSHGHIVCLDCRVWAYKG